MVPAVIFVYFYLPPRAHRLSCIERSGVPVGKHGRVWMVSHIVHDDSPSVLRVFICFLLVRA